MRQNQCVNITVPRRPSQPRPVQITLLNEATATHSCTTHAHAAVVAERAHNAAARRYAPPPLAGANTDSCRTSTASESVRSNVGIHSEVSDPSPQGRAPTNASAGASRRVGNLDSVAGRRISITPAVAVALRT